MRFRAFVSVDIEPDEQLVGLIRELKRSDADLKVVKPELLHFTLKFLGDTDEDLIDELALRIQESVSEFEPFSIKLVGMGAFPSISNIRVVWVGIQNGKELVQISERLDKNLESLGFRKDEKGFRPHLTIARAKSGRGISAVQEMIRERAASSYGEYRVSSVKLKKSVLSPQGPSYSTVRESTLSSR